MLAQHLVNTTHMNSVTTHMSRNETIPSEAIRITSYAIDIPSDAIVKATENRLRTNNVRIVTRVLIVKMLR